MWSGSTGASRSTTAGRSSARIAACRATSTPRCCSARGSAWRPRRARCSTAQAVATGTSSTSATACCRAPTLTSSAGLRSSCRSAPWRRAPEARAAGGRARGRLRLRCTARRGRRPARPELRVDRRRLARSLRRSLARAQAAAARRRADRAVGLGPRRRLALLLAARDRGVSLDAACRCAVPPAPVRAGRARRRLGRALARGRRRARRVDARRDRRPRGAARVAACAGRRAALARARLAAPLPGRAGSALRSCARGLAAARRDPRAHRGRPAGPRAQRLPPGKHLPRAGQAGRDRLGVLRPRRPGRRRRDPRRGFPLRRVLPGRARRRADRPGLVVVRRRARSVVRGGGRVRVLRGQRASLRLGGGVERALRARLSRAVGCGRDYATVIRMSDTAVILMAYGSPERVADVPAYYADIRGGRPIAPEHLDDLVSRYRSLGIEDSNPLNAITEATRAALQDELGLPVYTGMKHWTPRIAEAVDAAVEAGAQRLIGLVLAPHFSRLSIAGYREQLESALGDRAEVVFIESWHDDDGFISFLADRVRGTDAHVVFTAHSLPARIIGEGDPYKDQLLETAQLVADSADVDDWSFSFQSESPTGEPWLGPDILDHLASLKGEGVTKVLVCPVGFVSDHLEIRWDIDNEAQDKARELGLELDRIEMPNDDPRFVRTLGDIVRGELSAAAS